MQNIAIPAVLYDITGSLAITGIATFLQLLPFALLGPVGGVLADRYSRRLILIVSQSVAGVLALALYVAWVANVRSPALLIALASMTGAVAGLMLPSWQAFVTQLVPREQLSEAISLNALQFNLSRAFGPVLAAVMLHSGAQWAFLSNAVSFIAVVVGLLFISADEGYRKHDRLGLFAHIARGVRTVHQSTTLTMATALVFSLAFFGMPVISLMAGFSKDVFHYKSADSGYLTGALGMGAIAGVVALGVLKRRWQRSRITLTGFVVYGAGLFVFTLLHTFIAAIPVLFISGAGFLMVVVSLQTAVQLSVTDQVRGSVLALYFMAFGVGLPLGAALQGAASDYVSVRITVGIAAVSLLGVAALMQTRFHGANALNNETPEETPEETPNATPNATPEETPEETPEDALVSAANAPTATSRTTPTSAEPI